MALCMGCMQEIGDRRFCPACGFDNAEKQQAPFLPYGTVLANRYIVGAGIDTNGESTRYLCYDKQTGDVAIVAEFLPVGLFNRAEGETEVRVNYENRLVYNKLKDDFINYYRVVADLRELSALMNVHNIIEANNTAYVIEDSEDYIPFEEYVERSGGSLDWDVARPLFMPVISALEALHKRGVGHYAISPKNMYITSSGKLKISGFATENERKRGTSLKSQLFSGAAAPEQYEVGFPLDDITDIYGLCATLFYALTGHLPKSAPERVNDSRLLMSTTTVKKLPPHVVSALANGLQVERENRITDFDELRSQLSVAHTAKAIQDEISRTASMNISRSEREQKSRNGMSRVSIVIISAAATIVILGIAGVFWLMQNPLQGLFGGNQNATQSSTQSTEWTGPTVPNYVGMTYEEAAKAAEKDNSVTIMRTYSDEHSDEYSEGIVMAQSPAAGAKVNQEGTIQISLTVSKGSQMRELPKIEGQTLDQVSSDIAAKGLLASAEYAYSDKYAEGRVISYKNHQAGDTVEYGTNITVIVSKGKETSSSSSQ
ncbi:PASTA domain-containing protein [Ruminococcus sp.]|uniref:PASTA domain-containing protein n=1 Tax=Ruminococcus sp. TaxID=41978 RepID=UPI002E7655C0|nr:PASTA domain-containing protein [Ruminococcus sp.]MEE1264423.1 PASTA domain-containing protein [Ruminococcus sp.]